MVLLGHRGRKKKDMDARVKPGHDETLKFSECRRAQPICRTCWRADQGTSSCHVNLIEFE